VRRSPGRTGGFAFDNVPEDTVSIQARREDYVDVSSFGRHADDSIGIYPPSDQATPITIRLAPTASISGRVRDRKGVPITKDPPVILWRLTAWDGWLFLDFGAFPDFDADGTDHSDDLPPGRYALISDDQINVSQSCQ
jgi:hypothetical protein